MDNEKDIEIAKKISDYVNVMGHDYAKAAETMAHEHRYLQNEMYKFCMAYINKLSENYKKENYDARNHYACKMSNVIVETLEKYC